MYMEDGKMGDHEYEWNVDDVEGDGRYSKSVQGNIHFTIILTLASLFGPVFFIASRGDLLNHLALINSLLIAVVSLIRCLFFNPSAKCALMLNMTLILLLASNTFVFFFAVGPVVVNNHIRVMDSELVSIDSWLLGWLYPFGQVSIALDRSPWLNPSTVIGRLYTDFFEIVYLSYYLWGYLILFYFIYGYIIAWKRADIHSASISLARIKLYLCTWLFTYYMVLIFNVIIPAQSPRMFFADLYEHKLEGFGLTKYLLRVITVDSSFGSFPSGHVAESLVPGVFMWRVDRRIGGVVLIFDILIIVATQVIRYHYFVDLLGGAGVVVIGLCFGLCFVPSHFDMHVMNIAKSITHATGLNQGDGFEQVTMVESISDEFCPSLVILDLSIQCDRRDKRVGLNMLI